MVGPVTHHGKPPSDIDIDEQLVSALLRRQHPDFANLPIRAVDSGWDNAIFRLGEQLAVRMPRRVAVANLIELEQEWLPQLAPLLPIAVPAPVRLGHPSEEYPFRWSILPWLPGRSADCCEPRADQAERLAEFLCALHRPAPANAPFNPWRGVNVHERAAQLAERLRLLEQRTTLLDDAVMRIYEDALSAPMDIEPTWIHGDLHAGNLLVDEDGVITGVIDWGDMTRGDRAADLATIWMNLGDRKARENAMRACHGVSEATWRRARGWAIFDGIVLGASGLAGDARHAAMARKTFERIVSGP